MCVEGAEDDIEQFEKAARTAGKALKPKKSQALPGAAADRRWSKLTTVAAAPKGGLDVLALQTELTHLGLEHKFKHIIGLEELQS